jgi:hypothetical protein
MPKDHPEQPATPATPAVPATPARKLTPDDQWGQINYPSFMGAVLSHVKQIDAALNNVGATADNVHCTLNDVPITYTITENKVWVTIKVGEDASGNPQVEIYIPYMWLEGAA